MWFYYKYFPHSTAITVRRRVCPIQLDSVQGAGTVLVPPRPLSPMVPCRAAVVRLKTTAQRAALRWPLAPRANIVMQWNWTHLLAIVKLDITAWKGHQQQHPQMEWKVRKICHKIAISLSKGGARINNFTLLCLSLVVTSAVSFSGWYIHNKFGNFFSLFQNFLQLLSTTNGHLL